MSRTPPKGSVSKARVTARATLESGRYVPESSRPRAHRPAGDRMAVPFLLRAFTKMSAKRMTVNASCCPFMSSSVVGVGLSLAATLAIAGCGSDRTSGSAATASGQGGSDGMSGIGTELKQSTYDAMGGLAIDPGGRGGPGGNVDVVTTGALSFGAAFAAPGDAPAPPADAQRIASLDTDVSVTGTALIDGDLSAQGPRRLTISGGDLFIAGKVRSDSEITIEAPNGSIYVTGTIDTSGANGAPAGNIRISADRDVMLLGTIKGRGGAVSSGEAQGGAAATLAIDAGANVKLAGIVDLRGGSARGGASGAVLAGGAGGHLTIGAVRPPGSVTFALDVSVDGGDGHSGAGAGGSFTLVAGGDFTVAGTVRSRGGSIAPGGSGDGGLAGNFTMDINTIVGNQTLSARERDHPRRRRLRWRRHGRRRWSPLRPQLRRHRHDERKPLCSRRRGPRRRGHRRPRRPREHLHRQQLRRRRRQSHRHARRGHRCVGWRGHDGRQRAERRYGGRGQLSRRSGADRRVAQRGRHSRHADERGDRQSGRLDRARRRGQRRGRGHRLPR